MGIESLDTKVKVALQYIYDMDILKEIQEKPLSGYGVFWNKSQVRLFNNNFQKFESPTEFWGDYVNRVLTNNLYGFVDSFFVTKIEHKDYDLVVLIMRIGDTYRHLRIMLPKDFVLDKDPLLHLILELLTYGEVPGEDPFPFFLQAFHNNKTSLFAVANSCAKNN